MGKMDSKFLVHADFVYKKGHMPCSGTQWDDLQYMLLSTKVSCSRLAETNIQFDTGKFLEHIWAKHWTFSYFCGFLVTKSGAEHYLFIPHPSQRKVHNRPHISYNTKQSRLPVNVSLQHWKKCLPLSRLIPVLKLTKETSSVRKRPPSDELNQ